MVELLPYLETCAPSLLLLVAMDTYLPAEAVEEVSHDTSQCVQGSQ